jgi:hypothetical protein
MKSKHYAIQQNFHFTEKGLIASDLYIEPNSSIVSYLFPPHLCPAKFKVGEGEYLINQLTTAI